MSVNPHWDLFHQFSRAELASGGPDPQVLLTAWATQRLDRRRAAIAAGWFVVPYTCAAAAAIWDADLWDADEETLRRWLVFHHEGLPTRRERRSIWGTDKVKFARSLDSWRNWVDRHLLERSPPAVTYPELYDSISFEVAYFGRYATMKVIEVLYQAGLVNTAQSDLRARGAKYPRRALGLLWPEHADVVNQGGDSKSAVELAQYLAEPVRASLDVTWFQCETLLCNYRQSLDGKYPGRSHDRELAHWVRAEQFWNREALTRALPFFDLRSGLFPAAYLGERGEPPWWGAREELEVAEKQRLKEALACTSA